MRDLGPSGPAPGSVEDQLLRVALRQAQPEKRGWLTVVWEEWFKPDAIRAAAKRLNAEQIDIIPGLVRAWRVEGHPELTDNQLLDRQRERNLADDLPGLRVGFPCFSLPAALFEGRDNGRRPEDH